nr:hypothetical protein [uncultured Holophaga sp.]
MTSVYNAALFEGQNTVTMFRTWGKWISDAFATVGLIKTSDSGQVDWSSVAWPTTATTVAGYEIWRFNDSIQSAAPVFIKIEYGSGVNGGSYSGLWLTVGTGTDGAGTLTGVVSTRIVLSGDAINTTGLPSVISGGTNQICGLLWHTGCITVFAIERTHNSSGNDTSDGVQIWTFLGRGAAQAFQYISFSAAYTQYTHWNVSAPPAGTGVNGNNVALYPVRGWNPGETPASSQLFTYFTSDITAASKPSVTLWDGSSVVIFASSTSSISYGGSTGIAIRAD